MEGGRDKAARVVESELKKRPGAPFGDLTLEAIERWFTTGIPSAILSDPVRLAFIFTDLSSLVARYDVSEARREVRRQRLAYTGLLEPSELEPGDDPKMAKRPTPRQESAAAERLKKLGAELQRIAAESHVKGRRSGARLVAEKLEVPVELVRKWLAAGRVTGLGYNRLLRYELREQVGLRNDREQDAIFRALMKAGRKPAFETRVTERWDKKKARMVRSRKKVALVQVPTFRAYEGYYGGDATVGYRWGMPVRQYLMPSMVSKLCAMARKVSLDKMRRSLRRKLPLWAVYVVVSALYIGEERGHATHSKAGRAYGANVRQDLEAEFPEIGKNFVVKDAYSGGDAGTLEEAVRQFEKRMWREVEAGDRTFVHGLVVWHYRRRTTDELAKIVEGRRLVSRAERNKKKRLAQAKAGKRLRDRGKRARAEFERRSGKKRK